MKSLKHVSLLLVSIFVVANTFIGCAAADSSDDKAMDVKVDTLFELKLPDYKKEVGKSYYWAPTWDQEHVTAYWNKDYNWCFKAIKKGKTVIVMQLHETNETTGYTNYKKTIVYTINIK